MPEFAHAFTELFLAPVSIGVVESQAVVDRAARSFGGGLVLPGERSCSCAVIFANLGAFDCIGLNRLVSYYG
jgi:hypothetical protein